MTLVPCSPNCGTLIVGDEMSIALIIKMVKVADHTDTIICQLSHSVRQRKCIKQLD